MNEYRIWNIESGTCWSSNVKAESPYEAFTTTSNGDFHTMRTGTYLVAKTDGYGTANHNEFGVFKFTAPVEQRIVKVNLADLV